MANLGLSEVHPAVFQCLRNLDIDGLAAFSSDHLRAFLPSMVRMSLISPLETSVDFAEQRTTLLMLLSGMEVVNSIVALLSVNFNVVESDLRKEAQLRRKTDSLPGNAAASSNHRRNTATIAEFERSSCSGKVHVILSVIQALVERVKQAASSTADSKAFGNGTDQLINSCELFDDAVYLEEVTDVLIISLSELPNLIDPCDLADSLLHLAHGPWILKRFVANSPDLLWSVINGLIDRCVGDEEESPLGRIRVATINSLLLLDPEMSMELREQCLRSGLLPSLAIYLSLQKGDLVEFLIGILLGSVEPSRKNMIIHFVRSGQRKKSPALNALRKELIRRLTDTLKYLQNLTEGECKASSSVELEASEILRLCCVLKGSAGFKFTDEESGILLDVVTSCVVCSSRLKSVALSILFVCPSLVTGIEQEKRVASWLNGCLAHETGSFGELLLLLAIQLHIGQAQANINDLINSTLDMKVPVRSGSLTRLKQVFISEVFTESVITSYASKIPVTDELNASISGFLPIHCIHQLLKSRMFTKHKVTIKDWIYQQIRISVHPLHPALPALIEVYVDALLADPISKTSAHIAAILAAGGQQHHEPLSECELLAVFEDNSSMTSKLLCLYYVLLYEEIRCLKKKQAGKEYGEAFLAKLPIKYLVLEAQKHQDRYSGLYAKLLKRMVNHYPHLCLVEDWLENESVVQLTYRRCPKKTEIVDTLNAMKTNSALRDPRFRRALEGILHLPPDEMWTVVPHFLAKLPLILGDKEYRQVPEMYRKVWFRLNHFFPRPLWAQTANSLLRTYHQGISQEDLIDDPLAILRVDKEVFFCAPIFEIVLRILRCFLSASRAALRRNSSVPEEEITSVTLAQESCAVQILLEICLLVEDEGTNSMQAREIRSLICSYLHQVYQADLRILRMVHFQGYDLRLLPIVVRGVPSMHCCLDFLHELLNMGETGKQRFAICLLAEISAKYSLPRAMYLASLILSVVQALIEVLPLDTLESFFVPVLPALVSLARTYPPLCREVSGHLNTVALVASSRDLTTLVETAEKAKMDLVACVMLSVNAQDADLETVSR